jgi:hypothetical protein
MTSKKSRIQTAKPAKLQFQIIALAIFGDSENGRESERGRFTVNGDGFMSMEPVSRQHAAEINHAMRVLQKELGA